MGGRGPGRHELRLTDERAQERRQQIVDAATRCFARDGFHRATMLDIAREAGMSAGAFYRYFDSKEAVIEAIASDRHAQEAKLTAAAVEKGSAAEVLRELARGYFGLLTDPEQAEQRRVGIQVWAEALRNPRVHQLVRRGVDGPRAEFAALLDRARVDGELPAEFDPGAGARIMVALYQGFVLQHAWDEGADPEAYAQAVGVIVDALLGAAR